MEDKMTNKEKALATYNALQLRKKKKEADIKNAIGARLDRISKNNHHTYRRGQP